MQRVFQVTIGGAVVLAGTAFEGETAALGHALAACVFITAVQAHPLGLQVLEDPAQHGLERLRDKALALVIDIGDVAHFELGRIPIHHAHVDLPDEIAGRLLESAPEEAPARGPFRGQLADEDFPFFRGAQVQHGVAAFEALQVLAVAQAGLVVHSPIAGLVAAQAQPGGFQVGGEIEKHFVHGGGVFRYS